jgi:hypothetical protein
MYSKECRVCKKPFKSRVKHAMFCRYECSKEARKRREAGENFDAVTTDESLRAKGVMTLREISIAAKKEGLTYGQYVTKYRV